MKKKPNENIIKLDSLLDLKRCSDIVSFTEINPNPDKILDRAIGSKIFDNIPNLVKINMDQFKNSAFLKKISFPIVSSIQKNNSFGYEGNKFKNRFQNIIKPFNKITLLLLSIWIFTSIIIMYFF
jgi:hypothetical protein